MSLAAGTPLHTRSLSVTIAESPSDPQRVTFAAYLLDLRKRGFAPVGGDLQSTGIVHHMRLDGRLERATARIAAIDAQMPSVAFEASAATRGESCRDQIARVGELAGLTADRGWAPGLSAAIGGTRGCSHVLTLAHLLGPTARWALDEEARLHPGAARRPGERLFRRDVTVDGFEVAQGELVFTLMFTDLHLAPAPAVALPMDRFAVQREIVARATLGMHDLALSSLSLRERVRGRDDFSTAAWRERDADAAPLVGTSLRAGITARILGLLPDPAVDAPLRDALLQLAPALIQCFAALDIWTYFADDTAAAATGGQVDSCYMWRRDGALQRGR